MQALYFTFFFSLPMADVTHASALSLIINPQQLHVLQKLPLPTCLPDGTLLAGLSRHQSSHSRFPS